MGKRIVLGLLGISVDIVKFIVMNLNRVYLVVVFFFIIFSIVVGIEVDLRIRIFLKNMLKEEKGKEVSGVWKMKWKEVFRLMILFIVEFKGVVILVFL